MASVSVAISTQHSFISSRWQLWNLRSGTVVWVTKTFPPTEHHGAGWGMPAVGVCWRWRCPWPVSASLALQILTGHRWQGWKQKPPSLRQPLLLSLFSSCPYKKSWISVKVRWRCKPQMSEERLESWNKISPIPSPVWFQCTSLFCYLWHKAEQLSRASWGSNVRLCSDSRVSAHLLFSLG